jgi:hypothetical protein
MDYKAYYTALGQLVYAIAKSDGSIHSEEVGKIFNFVISQLVELEAKTGKGKDALLAFNTEKEFHRLRDNNVSVKDAYQLFVDFLDANKSEIDDSMKNTCLNLMENVALAHNGIEPPEKALIDKARQKILSL